MQSWGWVNVPPVATGKFIEDTKVRQVSPVSTAVSPERSDNGKINLKDRRLSLEQEIAKLRKKYSHEENLRKALERALQRPVGILPRIPSYLPAKTQKLLAEVALLEEEVIGLEDHVVFLRQEIYETSSQFAPHGSQKQRTNNDGHLNRTGGNLGRIRVAKDSSVKEVAKESSARAPVPSKVSPGLRKTPKLNNDPPLQRARDRDPGSKEQTATASKGSKFVLVTPSTPSAPGSSVTSPSFSEASRRTGGGVARGVAPPSGPPPTRKPPAAAANEALSKFDGGLQQPWKPTGGSKGKNQLFRPFNSLNLGQTKFSAVTAKQPGSVISSSPRNSPRVQSTQQSAPQSNLSVNWSDKVGHSTHSRSSTASSPRYSPRIGHGQPFTGTSSLRLVEKENLHSSTASKLISKSPRASKLGLSVDLSSSNVERKSMLGSKGSSTLLQTSRSSALTIIKEGVGPGTGPNRLAEELVRCLVAIYSKLTKFSAAAPALRGSRTSKTTSQSFDSKAKPSSELLRDVYGIRQDTNLVHIGCYQRAQEITVDILDSNGAGSANVLWEKMGTLLDQLEKAVLDALSHNEKLAFWINIYNVCMLHAFLEHFWENEIPNTPRKVVALMRKAVVNVGGFVLNALTIEHFILRQHFRPKDVKAAPWKHFQRAETNPTMAFLKNDGMEEVIAHSAFGLDRNEPMVTFALCCGTRSSPALRVYTSFGIESQLEIAKREYLQAAVGVNSQQKIQLPKLLEWYMRDFGKDMEGLLDWLCEQLSGSLRAAVQDCVNHPKEGVLSHSINVMTYDFNFRYLFLL